MIKFGEGDNEQILKDDESDWRSQLSFLVGFPLSVYF